MIQFDIVCFEMFTPFLSNSCATRLSAEELTYLTFKIEASNDGVTMLFRRRSFWSLQALIDDIFPILFANFVRTFVHFDLASYKNYKNSKEFLDFL